MTYQEDFEEANVLSHQIQELAEEGRFEEAGKLMGETIAKWRAAAGEDLYRRTRLAALLTNYSVHLQMADQDTEALEAGRESVALYRGLIAEDPESIGLQVDLASSLNNLALGLSKIEDVDGAVNAAREACDIFIEVVEMDPEGYSPDLARSQAALACALDDAEKAQDAAEESRKGIAVLAPLFLKHGLPLAELMDALLGLYIDMCDKAQIDPDDDLIMPIEELLEELDEDDEHDHDHECGPGCGCGE